jgi:hypothetical protein
MPKGEKVLAQNKKDRTTTNFQNFELRKDFSIDDFSIGILLLIEFQINRYLIVDRISNWFNLFKTNIKNPLEH